MPSYTLHESKQNAGWIRPWCGKEIVIVRTRGLSPGPKILKKWGAKKRPQKGPKMCKGQMAILSYCPRILDRGPYADYVLGKRE
jgi:hypothetical protein